MYERWVGQMMYYGEMSGWGFALMAISAVVFWGLVIVGIVMLSPLLRSIGATDDGRAYSGTVARGTIRPWGD